MQHDEGRILKSAPQHQLEVQVYPVSYALLLHDDTTEVGLSKFIVLCNLGLHLTQEDKHERVRTLRTLYNEFIVFSFVRCESPRGQQFPTSFRRHRKITEKINLSFKKKSPRPGSTVFKRPSMWQGTCILEVFLSEPTLKSSFQALVLSRIPPPPFLQWHNPSVVPSAPFAAIWYPNISNIISTISHFHHNPNLMQNEMFTHRLIYMVLVVFNVNVNGKKSPSQA